MNNEIFMCKITINKSKKCQPSLIRKLGLLSEGFLLPNKTNTVFTIYHGVYAYVFPTNGNSPVNFENKWNHVSSLRYYFEKKATHFDDRAKLIEWCR